MTSSVTVSVAHVIELSGVSELPVIVSLGCAYAIGPAASDTSINRGLRHSDDAQSADSSAFFYTRYQQLI